ncbi:MAG: amidohydrolase family protein [Planctomycetales bacterium]|nr:amidohydrolase family protein [Planctomycetales bacterium]
MTLDRSSMRRFARHASCRCVGWLAFCLATWLNVSVTHAHPRAAGAPQTQPVAIVNATIHLVSQPTLDKGTLLFDNGKVVAVGTEVALPPDTLQIDGAGKHVYPGLFCAVGQLGLTEINSIRATKDAAEAGEFNPNAKAQVAVNPDSELIPVTRANGVLLTLSSPTGGRIAGMSAVMQLDGWTWEDMTVRSPAAMHINWPVGERRGNRSGDALKSLREFFEDARRYQRARAASEAVPIDVRLDAMLPVLKGEVPVIVEADRRSQIEAAVAFAAEYQLKLIVRGGYDAESCAPLLRERHVPVIVPAVYRLPQRRHDPVDAAYTLPARLHQAGLEFCIGGDERFDASNLRNLPYHAATAVAYGLPEDEAIKALTLYPAQILGVADRVGSLEIGKHATLIVTDGSPLDTETATLLAFVQGRRVDLGSRHTDLAQKYEEKYRQLNGVEKQEAEKVNQP